MMRAGTYIGPNEALKGKKALLQIVEGTKFVKVQFDDVTTGFGHGWHLRVASEFEIEPPSPFRLGYDRAMAGQDFLPVPSSYGEAEWYDYWLGYREGERVANLK